MVQSVVVRYSLSPFDEVVVAHIDGRPVPPTPPPARDHLDEYNIIINDDNNVNTTGKTFLLLNTMLHT